MLARSLCGASVARKAISFSRPIGVSYKLIKRWDHCSPPAKYKVPTMDDVLVPCGSWQENYDNNQRKYNIHLLLGAGFFIITMCFGYYSNSLDLYIFPPDKPAASIY